MAGIDESLVFEFRDGLRHVAQQSVSRIRPSVRVEPSIDGYKASFDHIGKRRPNKRKGRHADTIIVKSTHTRRWVFMAPYDDAELLDEPDIRRVVQDPTNMYSQAMGMGFQRLQDEKLMDCSAATAIVGVDGDGTETATIDAACAYGNGTVMGIAKIKKAKRLHDGYENPTDRHWAMTAIQYEDLYGVTEVIHADIAVVRALAQGAIDSYHGFMWHRVEDPIIKAVSSNRKTVNWYKDALILGISDEAKSSIDRRPDKNNSWQIFFTEDYGTVRADDTGVQVVDCLEA